jgi:N-methylhydantoinase B
MAADSQSLASTPALGAGVDAITAEIIMHRLCAIPNLIDRNITRTAFSILISEYKDYAVGIVDARGQLICQCSGGLPIFIANALSAAVREGLELYGAERLRHGDVVINNRAATMGQHLNNVVMYTPIRTGPTDELFGFMAIVMHWVDIGGTAVGSSSTTSSTEIFQEGIQFPTMKLMAEGRRVEDVFRLIEANTRFPKLVMGDLEAQIAGCLLGRNMVMEVIAKYTLTPVREAVSQFWSRSEQAMRAAIRDIPDGTYRASSFLDDDGISGNNIPIEVAVVVHGDALTVDLSNIADQVKGPLNAGYEGGAVAAARIACKYLFSPHEPANHGSFVPIKVVCPPGKILSARPGAPLAGSGKIIPTVVDTILRAFAGALPDRVPAAHHGTYGIHVIFGTDEDGNWFRHLESTIGGWGASRQHDGPGPYRSMAHGDTLEVPVELQEANYPYLVEAVRLRQDSGGAGTHRGGLGVEKLYRLNQDCSVYIHFERTQCPPWGLEGGGEGQTGRVEIRSTDGGTRTILKEITKAKSGDRIAVLTAGGGGFGNPHERTVHQIVHDLEEGYISTEAARRDYGAQADTAVEILQHRRN